MSQSFDIFDIDTSEYPLMKAKFISIDANQNQVINHSKDDFELIENGEQVDITDVSCEPNLAPISIVVYVNLSDSDENREITSIFLESMINSLPNNGSELCIISSWGYFFAKFTEDKNGVFEKVKTYRFSPATNYDRIFNDSKTGALEVMKSAKNSRRKIVLLTSWYINGDGNDVKDLIAKARNIDTRIDCILVKLNPLISMANLIDSTGGVLYKLNLLDKNIKTNLDNQAKTIIDSYCNISWNASKTCDTVLNLKAIDKKNGAIDSISYKVTTSRDQSLSFSESFMNFGVRNINSTIDTSIRVTSNYDYITINSINFEPNFTDFKVLSKLPITLSKGQSAKIEFQVNVKDKDRKYTNIVLNTDFCDFKSSILIGSEEVSINSNSVKIIQPNGGEIYRSGSDAQITWSGMPDNESVNLKFSSNNGESWNKISDSKGASDYIWRVPNIVSNNCLVSVDKLDSPTKTMKEGDIVWSKAYGDFNNDNAVKVIEANDGGYIVLGVAKQINSASDYIVITKISESGDIVWDKSFGGSLHSNSSTVINTNDNNYLLVRQSYSGSDDVRIEKIDNYGNVLWFKNFGGSKDDIPTSVIQAADGSYLIAGSTESRDKDFKDLLGNNSRENVFLLKIDSLGNRIWLKGYNNGDDDIASSLIESYDGNYLITGYRSDSHSDWDISLKNIDKDGNLIWSKYYKGSREEKGSKIIQDFDGGFIISGFTSSIDGVFEGVKNNSTIAPLIMKVDIKGNIMWIRTFPGSEAAYAYTMTKLSDGSLLGAGVFDDYVSDLTVSRKGSYDEGWLVKITSDNKIEYIKNFGGSFDDNITDMIQDKNGDFILVGQTGSEDYDLDGSNLRGRSDNWIFKLKGASSPYSDVSDAVFSIRATGNSIPVNDNVIQLLHNVELEYVTVKIDLEEDSNTDIVVYDQLGHKVETVHSGALEKGESEFTIDLKNYFSSRYYVRLITPSYSKTKFIEVLR